MAKLTFKRLTSLSGISPTEWNALVEAGNPFMRYEFLAALEETGCTGKRSGWQPAFTAAFDGDKLVAVIPAYLRADSYGEYIFDWAWANAYEQAGLRYYPKVTVAAPFTPATGRRILSGGDDTCVRELVQNLEAAVHTGSSGIHFLCLTRAEQKLLSELGYLPRLTHQYHWLNRGFENFDDYLSRLRAHRRKEIRRERKKCAELGLDIVTLTGKEITEEHMRAMYTFYIQTYSRKWGSPYLNLECFLLLRQRMPGTLVLVLAREGGTWVAGSIAFRRDDKLFGRYWGAAAHYPYLHFELCFYRLIDFAIREKISLFEAGAQGEHKFQRGFTAMPVYSSHKLFHPQGAEAISAFLTRERKATARALRAYRATSPNKDEPAYLPEAESD
ncbi:MAG: GNAT family N-acetyltransferase [Spirochaetes bacterium]|nr:GNAT family N-acetyltransferase [Spirochaetota bacterium]